MYRGYEIIKCYLMPFVVYKIIIIYIEISVDSLSYFAIIDSTTTQYILKGYHHEQFNCI